MTTLLRNRLPVTVLAAALLLAWLGDVLDRGGRANAARTASLPHPADLVGDPETLDTEWAIHSALRLWLERRDPASNRLREDPFSYPESPTAAAAAVEPTAPAITLPVLTGISLGSGKPLAVLDRAIVGEGEVLGSWRVDRIEPDQVRVTGPAGSVALRLDRGPVDPSRLETAPAPAGSRSPSAAPRARNPRPDSESD